MGSTQHRSLGWSHAAAHPGAACPLPLPAPLSVHFLVNWRPHTVATDIPPHHPPPGLAQALRAKVECIQKWQLGGGGIPDSFPAAFHRTKHRTHSQNVARGSVQPRLGAYLG